MRTGTLGIALATAVTAAVVLASTACAKDGASYKAGWATGVNWAGNLLPNAGPVGIPDAEVTATCPSLARSAEGTVTYYFQTGRIPGAQIVHSDFVSGCVAGARSVIG